MASTRSPMLSVEERWAAVLVCGLVAGPAWLRGGTHASWMHPWLWIALLSSVLLFGLARRRFASPATRIHGGWYRGLRRDPVLWIGLVFIGLLLVQWWNAGRALYFDTATQGWTYSPPRHPTLPSAITSGDARQMLDWFVPAGVILLALRSPLLTGGATRLLWRLLAYQAGLLALFGIAQFAWGDTRMYGRIPMQSHFFAAFGYPNHAGSYFLLVMPLAVGLICHEFAIVDNCRRWTRIGLLGAAFFLALVGANLSLSRSAILLSWALMIPLGALSLAFFWPRIAAAWRVNAVVSGVAVLCLAMLLTIGLGREAIRREFKPESDHKTLLERETSFRLFQVRAAARIWRDHPWFGVGGWGYRYLLAQYLPPEEWRHVGTGKANAHNDAMQFLAEFGLLGAVAMTGIAVLLVISVVRSGAGWPPVVLFPLLGAGLVCLQGLIDLPFRSPAVLYLWLVCLAGAARAVSPARQTP